MKFNIGDKVRCIKPYDGYTVGKVYTVEEFEQRGNHEGWNSVRGDCGSPLMIINYPSVGDHFEHVSLEENKLAQLVRTANEGLKAIQRLGEEFSDRVVRYNPRTRSYDSGIVLLNDTYQKHIEIKPLSRHFYINLHACTIDGNTVKVGCQSFDKSKLTTELRDILRNGTGKSEVYELRAARNGVKYKSHEITWADAEKLLEELEK